MNCAAVGDVIRHLNKLPENFQFYKFECFPKDANRVIYVEFTGGLCRKLKSGKRKGQWGYRGATDVRKFAVTIEDGEKMELQYESIFGKCHPCGGKGEVMASWSIADGMVMRMCRRCGGTGVPPGGTYAEGLVST